MAAATRFLLALGLTSLMVLAAITLLLWRNGEFWTTGAGAKAQFQSNGIYGRSVWDDFFAYKFALYELRPKAYVSVGSSRAMSTRAELFRDGDHLSFGGAVNSVGEFHSFVTQAMEWKHFPKVIFIYVDAEWFVSGARPQRHVAAREPYESPLYLYQSAFIHLKELVSHAISPSLESDPRTGGRLVGSRAQRLAEGFRTDGTIRHHYYLTNYSPWHADELASFLIKSTAPDAINNSRRLAISRGWWNAKVLPQRVSQFRESLKLLATRADAIVMLMAPVAPHLGASLESLPELSFFPNIRTKLEMLARENEIPWFDFTRIPLQDVSCFIDYYHASEGAIAVMLAQIQRELEHQRHPAAQALDMKKLAKFGSQPCLREIR